VATSSFVHSGEIHRPDGSVKAFLFALLLHVLLVVLLVAGVRWQMPAKPAAIKVMQATVVQDDAAKRQIDQLKRDNEKLLAIEMQKAKQVLEAGQARQKELEKQKSLDQAKQQELDLKRLSAEKKKLEEKKAAETQKQAAELNKKQLAAEQQKKDALLRRKQVESGLQEQLAAEEKERNQAKAAALAERQRGEIARYEDIIRQKVTRSWARPPGAREGLECVVLVRVVPGGAVLSTQVMRTSGNPIFDRSAENAINRASPLPVPDDKSMFEHFREFEFKFRPEG
jgi:colicin import membrane protein